MGDGKVLEKMGERRKYVRRDATVERLSAIFLEDMVGSVKPSTLACYRRNIQCHILPALGNEFIMIVKDTSLGSTFFIGDLMTQYLVVKGATYLPIEPLVIVGVIYFIMTFVLSKVFGHLERKMKKADRNNGYGRKRKQQREVHI